MNPDLIILVRTALKMNQPELAAQARVGETALRGAESGKGMSGKTEIKLRDAFSRLCPLAGIEIVDEPGRYGVIFHRPTDTGPDESDPG